MNAVTIQHEASIMERLMFDSDAAHAILSLRFGSGDEQRMRKLMEKNNQGTITEEEKAEMEAFRQVGSFLAILQAKARLKLRQHNGDGSSAE